MARRGRGNKSAPRIRYVGYHDYVANAKRWKTMRFLVAPTEEAKAAGAFIVVNNNEWWVFRG